MAKTNYDMASLKLQKRILRNKMGDKYSRKIYTAFYSNTH